MADTTTSYISFPISSDQTARIHILIERIREDPGSKALRKELIELINELADTGINYFFLQSLRDADVGFLKIKSAEVGLYTLKSGLFPILRGFVNGMNNQQLLKVLDFMEGILMR